jgi:hypothetical protein
MPKIPRHKTVSLDAGGWLDLKGCDVLWSSGTVKSMFFGSWVLNRLFPGGVFFARTGGQEILLRTEDGRYVIKQTVPPSAPFTPYQIHWRHVSPTEAFLWLQHYSRRHARRLFPELQSQQKQQKLPGEF